MYQVVSDVFLVLQVQGLFAFCMNRVNTSDLETHITKRLQQTFPDRSSLVGMMKSENQQSMDRKAFVYPSEHIGQTLVEIFQAPSSHPVFNDLFCLRTDIGHEPGITILECDPQPDIEEIRKLRVVDVSDIRTIGNHNVGKSTALPGKTVRGLSTNICRYRLLEGID